MILMLATSGGESAERSSYQPMQRLGDREPRHAERSGDRSEDRRRGADQKRPAQDPGWHRPGFPARIPKSRVLHPTANLVNLGVALPENYGVSLQTLVEESNTLVQAHPRWGFWKCIDRMRDTGRRWNHKRALRVYRGMKQNRSRRTKKRIPYRERQRLVVSVTLNHAGISISKRFVIRGWGQ